MAYKLIAIDLDDTLLDENKECSRFNALALQKAAQKGLHVVLTSGRAQESVAPYSELLGIKDYAIAIAGAQVFDTEGKLIFSTALPSDLAADVMRWAHEKGLHYQAYLPDTGLTFPKRDKYAVYYEEHCNIKGTVNPDLKDIKDIETPKLLIIDEPGAIAGYKAELKPLFPQLKFENSQPEYLEILNPQTSKGNALKWLAEKLQIVPEEIIAIGDSELDVSMLKYAGLGIAVKNGDRYALENADYITGANNNDGVGKAIEKFVLI